VLSARDPYERRVGESPIDRRVLGGLLLAYERTGPVSGKRLDLSEITGGSLRRMVGGVPAAGARRDADEQSPPPAAAAA
jgi:hypothetical protein